MILVLHESIFVVNVFSGQCSHTNIDCTQVEPESVVSDAREPRIILPFVSNCNQLKHSIGFSFFA